MNKMILCLLFTSLLFSQDLDKLRKDSIRISNTIRYKSDSLTVITDLINTIKTHRPCPSQNLKNNFSMIAICKTDCEIRKNPNEFSKVIYSVSQYDTIRLVDFNDNDYWLVSKGELTGYLSDIYIQGSNEIESFKKELISYNEKILIEKENNEIKAYNKQTKKKNEAYRKKIINKYGNTTGEKLLKGFYWIGMTDEMAIISQGKPNTINKSVGSWGVNEQWVYNGKYIYFENGLLTSYQNSR